MSLKCHSASLRAGEKFTGSSCLRVQDSVQVLKLVCGATCSDTGALFRSEDLCASARRMRSASPSTARASPAAMGGFWRPLACGAGEKFTGSSCLRAQDAVQGGCTEVARRSHGGRMEVTQMSLKCHSKVTQMSFKCHSNITQMSLNRLSNASQMSLSCHSNVTQMPVCVVCSV